MYSKKYSSQKMYNVLDQQNPIHPMNLSVKPINNKLSLPIGHQRTRKKKVVKSKVYKPSLKPGFSSWIYDKITGYPMRRKQQDSENMHIHKKCFKIF